MKLIAYHSNLYFDAFVEHVKEIKAKGFDSVLLCITETDIKFNLETFREFRIYAQKQGMECWCTFWGKHAGEAICKDCDIKEWLKAVKSIGFRNVMIDEVKNMDDVLTFIEQDDIFNFHLCLCDATFNKLTDSQIWSLPVKSVGVSCYHIGHKDWSKVVRRTHDITKRLKKLRTHESFIFIQAFDIAEGMEYMPIIVKEIAEINGIENFGVWSFRATSATSSKRPANPELVWQNINFNYGN